MVFSLSILIFWGVGEGGAKGLNSIVFYVLCRKKLEVSKVVSGVPEEWVRELDVIQVWDCRGVLLSSTWVSEEDVKARGLRWVTLGCFKVPLPRGVELDGDRERMVVRVLFCAVQRWGAINISGFYPFEDIDRKRLLRAVKGELRDGDAEEVVERVMEELKGKPMVCLWVWDSRWSEGCDGACREHHRKTFVCFDGEGWMRFGIGMHHAYSPDMWDIKPERVSEEEARRMVRRMVKRDVERWAVFDGEAEDYVARLCFEELAFCEKHKVYYFKVDGCHKCSELWGS